MGLLRRQAVVWRAPEKLIIFETVRPIWFRYFWVAYIGQVIFEIKKKSFGFLRTNICDHMGWKLLTTSTVNKFCNQTCHRYLVVVSNHAHFWILKFWMWAKSYMHILKLNFPDYFNLGSCGAFVLKLASNSKMAHRLVKQTKRWAFARVYVDYI